MQGNQAAIRILFPEPCTVSRIQLTVSGIQNFKTVAVTLLVVFNVGRNIASSPLAGNSISQSSRKGRTPSKFYGWSEFINLGTYGSRARALCSMSGSLARGPRYRLATRYCCESFPQFPQRRRHHESVSSQLTSFLPTLQCYQSSIEVGFG